MNLRYWYAQSVSGSLAERLAGRDLLLHVLSVHHRACNLISDQSDIVALVTREVGNGPFHIVLAEPVPALDRLRRGDVGRYHQKHLQVMDIFIDLRHAVPWEPKVAWPNPPVSETAMAYLADHVSIQTRISGRGSWVTGSTLEASDLGPRTSDLELQVRGRASQAVKNLLAGLEAGDVERITWGVDTLTGLGPGLTPAGDDFLVGLMAGLRAWPMILPSGWTADHACRLIIQVAAYRTTLLSATWLRHAAAGEFAATWHELVQALADADEAGIRGAANRILDTGATSGADAMAGFLAPFLARYPSPHG